MATALIQSMLICVPLRDLHVSMIQWKVVDPEIETLTAMHFKIVGLTCDRNKRKFTTFTSVGLGLVNGHLKEKYGYKNVEQSLEKSSRKQIYIYIFRMSDSGIRRNFA